MNKRGTTGTGHIVVIILAVLVALVLLVLAAGHLIPLLFHSSKEELCQQSVAARAATIVKFAGLQKDLGLIKDLNCETKYVVVKDGGVYEDEKLCYQFEEKNVDRAIKRTVADEMYDCWKMMGEGKLEIWGGGESKVHCIICSEISFDMENPPEKIARLDLFLKNTPISDRAEGTTYAEYFKFNTDQITDYEINPGVPLDVVYIQTDHTGAIGEFFSDAKSGCKKGMGGGLLDRIPVVGGVIGGANKVMNFATGGFISDCLMGAVANPIMSHFTGEEDIQPMLLVLPATEFNAAKCDTTY